jgi:class 3 adenylate cyclase
MVTVMFADLSGFTALAENMDPERVRSLMNACFDHLVPIIEKYEGVIDKFIGDEIMALFGAPVAHEDDPARALCAALDMMGALERFNTEHSTNLGLHVGVNTGLAVAGGIGSRGRQQYSVIGDAVNLASRLESVSEPGEILLGPDTYRLTAPLFDFESLEPIQVQGRAEPVRPYRLLGLKTRPGSVRGLAGLHSPMVGRDAELAVLLELSQALEIGTGRVALVVGEPGLGKTRLIREWKEHLLDRASVRWAEGHCLSYGQELAYHLVVDLLRSLIGVSASDEETKVQAALLDLTQQIFGGAAPERYPYLAHLLSLHLDEATLERVRSLDPLALQAQYLSALRRLFQALAEQAPLILILEDIHWADSSSIALLVKLLPLALETRLLFGFVMRPYHDAPGWKLVEAAREQVGEGLSELTLQSLGEADSRRLIANLLEIEDLPENVRSLILKKAEGNPLFVEEVIRMLIDHGLVFKQHGRWITRGDIEDVEIPDNLQSLLLARIDRLPEEARHILRVASVIGRQFSVRVLAEVLERI